MRSGVVSVVAILVLVGVSALFLLRSAGGHPLAEKRMTDGSVCGALLAGPGGGVAARAPGNHSPLAPMLGTVPICDIPTAAGPISMAVTTRLALRNAGGGDDTAGEATSRQAEGSRTGQVHREIEGPWRKAWTYRTTNDPRAYLQAEDNGVLLLFAGPVDDQTLIETARRAAEALRAAMP
jgi:hypothetical protein